MEMNFYYYRIPDTITKPPPKGRPHHDWLHRYFRGYGWARLGFVGRVAPKPKGGRTVCRITVNGKDWIGDAYCSHSDNFCYALGRQISLGRAMKLYEQEMT